MSMLNINKCIVAFPLGKNTTAIVSRNLSEFLSLGIHIHMYELLKVVFFPGEEIMAREQCK